MDLVARIGGEEFLVAIPDTGLEEARIVADRLCGIMREQPIALPDGRAITVTMSMGLAMGGRRRVAPGGLSGALPTPGAGDGDVEATELMQAADQALYGAKSCGRAQFKISAPPPERAPGRPRGNPLARPRRCLPDRGLRGFPSWTTHHHAGPTPSAARASR